MPASLLAALLGGDTHADRHIWRDPVPLPQPVLDHMATWAALDAENNAIVAELDAIEKRSKAFMARVDAHHARTKELIAETMPDAKCYRVMQDRARIQIADHRDEASAIQPEWTKELARDLNNEARKEGE